jgi:predicted MFS family arabinose efflux permease
MLVNRAGSFVVPFLAIYLTQARGFSAAQAGIVAAVYGAGAAVASPLGGFLADHAGRRATLIGALALGGIGMIALGFAREIAVIARCASWSRWWGSPTGRRCRPRSPTSCRRVTAYAPSA